MKQIFKILLINIGVAVVVTVIALLVYSDGMQASDIGVDFGLVCLGLGGLDIFIGFILVLIPERRQVGRALLLSGAVLLLLCGISCGSALSGMRF